MKTYDIPYSTRLIPVQLPEEQVDFTGELTPAVLPQNWKGDLLRLLDAPTAGPGLKTMLRPDQHIVVLVEDNTRHTPVREILPILCDYLTAQGCSLDQVELLVAPGTHRILTEEELLEKLGPMAVERLKISQHDYRDRDCLVRLEEVSIAGMTIPVTVNRIAVEADLLIGIGNIIPHPNAGYSGGAKILCPGCCGPETVSAMHTACALMGYLPLGMKENACRDSLEKVAAAAGLDFLINVVLDEENRVAGVVTGDFIRAHRAGADMARDVFGVPIRAEADILISCSYPYDIDFWQCEKAMISGYFALKQGGTLILPAPCLEGLAHNHDELLDWMELTSDEAARRIRNIFENGGEGDLVAAAIALGSLLVKEKAGSVFLYTEGLTAEQTDRMGYRLFDSLQAAVDAALAEKPRGRIGILPRAGDCLPYVI